MRQRGGELAVAEDPRGGQDIVGAFRCDGAGGAVAQEMGVEGGAEQAFGAARYGILERMSCHGCAAG